MDEHDLADQAITILAADPDYAAERAQAVSAVQAVMPRADPVQIEATIDEMLESWCIEILCDALGLEIAGVAFLYALAAFLMSRGYGEPGSEHPPNTVRMRIALDHLQVHGWGPHLTTTTPTILAWLESIAADAGASLQQPSAFLRDIILRHAQDFRQLAENTVGPASIDATACADAAGKTAELLSLRILPVEYESKLDRRGILTGAWQRAVAIHGDSPEAVIEAIGDDDLQELVGKALELSTVAEVWEQL